MTNCRVGDLAIVVSAPPYATQYIGVPVKIAALDHVHNGYTYWLLEAGHPFPKNTICDFYLKPLRDNPGDDETLSWTPVPQHKEVAA